MNKTLIFLSLLFFACNNRHQKGATVSAQTTQQKTVYSDSVVVKTLAFQFDLLNTLVRDNKIEKTKALKELQRIFAALQTAYHNLNPDTVKNGKWFFPVAGYSSKAIGGTHGEGYVPNGYDYFLGNKHGGHPAHDIFIYDNNQDSKDDRTRKFVNVLSVGSGIVVALEKEWDSTSSLRGGKYIWIYAPTENALYYYAHNADVFVNVGQTVNAGDTIAIVGRTGLNAFKQRSPTHLHFMKLTLDKEFYPKPDNTYQKLLNAKSQ
ncbi:hypothetical protein FACS1894121_0760 [Bacteroidia bacterium]|nr:hypothetical protein FACS1894121_0760 [Bacteroidia bacterium]